MNALSSQTLQRGVNVVLGMAAGANAVGMFFNVAMRIIDLPRTAISNGLLVCAAGVLPAQCRAVAIAGVPLTTRPPSAAFCDAVVHGGGASGKQRHPVDIRRQWADAVPCCKCWPARRPIGNTAMYATTALVAVNRQPPHDQG